MGQLVAQEASRRLGVPFGIVDLSLAPTPAMGDSVAHILEEMGLEQCGAHGTTAALALLNDAVKKGGVMASSSVGGLSGAFIPVTEDAGMIDAARSGCLTLDKLEAMTAVCSRGPGYDRHPRRHPGGDHLRHHRRRGRHRHGQLQDHRRASLIPAVGRKAGEDAGLWRPAGQGPHYAGKPRQPRGVHPPGRANPRAHAEFEKLKRAQPKRALSRRSFLFPWGRAQFPVDFSKNVI